MNTTIQVYKKDFRNNQVANKSFFQEMKEGWEWFETDQKRQRLREYKRAYEEETDKDSFNAQMLATYIDLFESELK
jgi:hypothetical protein